MKNDKEKNLSLLEKLHKNNLNYFFVDNLRNSNFDNDKYLQKKTFYDNYFGIF